MWFNKEHEDLMLKEHVKKAIKGISFCGMDLSFLNYSASQIKSRSWWQYIDNHGILSSENLLNRDKLLSFIGQFTDKKKLKQLARQGQSMSSSTFI